jgi:hypothetical protein
MSDNIQNIIRAVVEEIQPKLPKLSSEKSRVEMRSLLLSLEKMVKDIRRQLLQESRDIKNNNKLKKNKPPLV